MAMTPIQVFDALSGKTFDYLECRDGSAFGGTSVAVSFCDDPTADNPCIEVREEGLILHFNSKDSFGNKRGESVWLADIVAVR